MAYVLDEEDDEKQQPAQGVVRGGIPTGFGFGAPAGQTSAPSQASAQPPQTGTDFVSWDRILSANKDAAAESAKKMADKTQAGAQDVQGRLRGAQSTFGDAVRGATPQRPGAPSPGLTVGSGGGTGGKPAPAVNAFNQPTGRPAAGLTQASPTAPTPAPGYSVGYGRNHNLTPEEAQERAGRTYQGPGSLSEGPGWDELLSSGREAGSRANAAAQRDGMGNLRGDAGLEELLRDEALGNYSRGASRMDAALLGQSGRKRFDELQRDYGGLTKEIRQADAASRLQSQEAKDAVAADAAAAGEAFEAYDKPKREAAAAEKQAKEDEENWTQHGLVFSHIETLPPGPKADAIAELDRYWGAGTYESLQRWSDTQLKKPGARKSADGTLEKHYTFT